MDDTYSPESGPPLHLDMSCWDELIESVGPASILVLISSWMSERLKRHCTAEDIWQETLWMAWRDREKHEWRSRQHYRAWLLQIAKNRIRDAADGISALKRGGDRRIAGFATLLGDHGSSLSRLLPARSTTPSRVVGQTEQARQMETALQALPENLQPVVRMHLFEQKKMESVAEELDIGLDAAWYRFRKGAVAYAAQLRRQGFSSRGGSAATGGFENQR